MPIDSDALAAHLATAGDWKKMRTAVPGAFIVKIPARKTTPARLMLELNPVDEIGFPTKRKGLYIADLEQVQRMREIITNPQIEEIFKAAAAINAAAKAAAADAAAEAAAQGEPGDA